MLRLLVDENVHGAITRGLLRRRPTADLVRVQDVGLTGVDDHAVLEWAAAEGRVVVTSDVATLVGFAYDRLEASMPMPGVFVVSQGVPIGPTIDDLALLDEAGQAGEWEGRVLFLPL